MNELQKAIVNKVREMGWDTEVYNPALFSAEQMLEIFAAQLAGIPIEKIANPDYTKDEMEKIRLKLSESKGYELTDAHADILESISPENIFMKSMIDVVTCFFSETSESVKDLRKAVEVIEEVTAVEVTDDMRSRILFERQGPGKMLVTTNTERFMYNVTETENYLILKNVGLISLKIRKEAG